MDVDVECFFPDKGLMSFLLVWMSLLSVITISNTVFYSFYPVSRLSLNVQQTFLFDLL